MKIPEDAIVAAQEPINWDDPRVRRHLSRLAQVAQRTASIVIITDRDGTIVWINGSFTRTTGYELHEAIGRRPGDLLQGAETDLTVAARVGLALRAGEGVSAEMINYAKDGRKYWVGMKIEPLLDANGAIDGFMAIEADITTRYEQRRALELSTFRFNMATRSAQIGVYERSLDEGQVWWSDVMWEIYGQSPLDFELTAESWLKLVHPDDRERVGEVASSTGRTRQSSDLVYRILRPDGSIRHVQSIGSSENLSQHGGGRSAGVTFDVSARVDAEAREAALQQQLRETSHQAGMAEIATGILHNVGNVLNSVGIANTTARRALKELRLDRLEQTSAMLRDNRHTLPHYLENDERGKHLPEYLPALTAQIVAKVQGAQAELATVDGFLEHLREIVSTQQVMAKVGGVFEPLAVHELMESALQVQAPELQHITVVRDYEDSPVVVTDRHKLLQILVNLIGNARDAMQDDGDTPKCITLRVKREANCLLICVEDSGIGMPAEVVERLFRFGFTTKANGHGFGLHNSANAARQIGATLSANSDGLGHGSRFTIRLPLVRSPPALQGAAA